MTTLLHVMIPLMVLVEKGPEPKDVKAGWVGLLVFVGLGAAVVFLAFSLRKHLGNVDFEEAPDGSDDDASRPGRGPDGGPDGEPDGGTGTGTGTGGQLSKP